MLSIVNETVDSLSHDLSCDQTDILTVRLMCIGCRGNDDVITPGDEDILKMAVQHGDEQVIMRVGMIIIILMYIHSIMYTHCIM